MSFTVFNPVIKILTVQLTNNWSINNPVSPVPAIIWPNVDDDKSNHSHWIEFIFVPGDLTPQSTVNGRLRGVGSMVIDIATPTNIGVNDSFYLADHIGDIFSNKVLGDKANRIHMQSVKIHKEGVVHNNFWMLKTETIFHLNTCG